MSATLVQVRDLTIALKTDGREVVRNVSLEVAEREIVGIVGESGSGKTLASRALLTLLPPAVAVKSGTVLYKGRDMLAAGLRDLRLLRGREIGMVFQEPMTSLNPSMTIGRQLEEGLILHTRTEAAARRAAILAMLERVGIEDAGAALAAYPHEFSGGMRQRIMLASVMLLRPALLIADEPTTALDAVVQREVMELIVELTRENGTAVLLISHDLPMVARYTSRVVVMEKGSVVEAGTTEAMLDAPQHPYTRKLLSSLPIRSPMRPLDRAGTPIVSVRDVVVDYPGCRSILRRGSPKRALHGVSLDIQPGEAVALVGGSGSGKTTLGRAIAGLVAPSAGEIRYRGTDRGSRWAEYRRNCQMVFQDPYSSLDPRMSIRAIVEEGLRHEGDLDRAARCERAAETLEEVGLGLEFAERFAHELSGGQRQRVAIARAVARRPAFLIADEPVSALDVTVRAQVLALFAKLQRRHGFACLFISHDLGVVEQVADRVVVMRQGRIVEQGDRDTVFDDPQHAYTRTLLSAIPALSLNERGGVHLKWRLEA